MSRLNRGHRSDQNIEGRYNCSSLFPLWSSQGEVIQICKRGREGGVKRRGNGEYERRIDPRRNQIGGKQSNLSIERKPKQKGKKKPRNGEERRNKNEKTKETNRST
jgi:hypothetical protein